jgi:hypothetical protein
MRHRLAVPLIGCLVLVLNLSNAEGAIKSGSSCKKIGQVSNFSGKKYTCVKSGKKLIWNKGVTPTPIPSPSVTPTPTPSATPTPTESKSPVTIERKLCATQPVTAVYREVPGTNKPSNTSNVSLWEKYKVTKPINHDVIMASVKSTFTKNYGGADKKVPLVDFYIDPELQTHPNIKEEVDALIKVLQFENQLARKEFIKPISVVIFNDWAWLEKIHIDGGCSNSVASNRASKTMDFASGWASSDNLTLYMNYSGTKKENLSSGTRGYLAAHEIFHLVQFQNFSQFGGNPPMNIPGWFTEGGASLIPPLVLNTDFSWWINLDNTAAKSSDPKSSLENLPRGSSRVYSLGPIANEFIVYLTGFDKYMNIWLEMGKGKSFESAFYDATGIELVDFYTMFEEIRPALGIPIL